ncbi:ATP-dependent DNA helicase yku80 [Dimargaris xerosporica]|nr:ATP-dependent DNA helicase yku80 [Dimargaris xerosporica]
MSNSVITVNIVDVGATAAQRLHSPPNESYQAGGLFTHQHQVALHLLETFIVGQILQKRKCSVMSTFLCGSEVTNNYMSMAVRNGYRHIQCLHSVQVANWSHVAALREVAAPTTKTADLLDTLILAIDEIVRHCGARNFQKRICLFVTRATPIHQADSMIVMEKLVQSAIQVDVVGVDMDAIPCQLGAAQAMMQLRTNRTIPTRDYLVHLARVSGGLFRTSNQILHNPTQLLWQTLRPVARRNTHLILRSESFADKPAHRLPIKLYARAFPWSKPTVPRALPAAPDEPIECVPLTQVQPLDATYQPGSPMSNPPNLIHSRRMYYLGTTLVPFLAVDTAASIPPHMESGLHILGFFPQTQIHPEVACDSMVYVASPGSPTFLALVSALHETESAALVGYALPDGSALHIGALFPDAQAPDYLYYTRLPFAEEWRPAVMPVPAATTPTANPDEAVDALAAALIDATQLESKSLSSDGHPTPGFLHPGYHYLNQVLTHKALVDQHTLPMPSPNLIAQFQLHRQDDPAVQAVLGRLAAVMRQHEQPSSTTSAPTLSP